MSTTEDIEELLPAYVAGELPDSDRAQVDAALARSPRLRAELGRYQQLFLLLALTAREAVEAPASLEGRIARQIAVRWSLRAAISLLDDLLGAYGRALVTYLGLA